MLDWFWSIHVQLAEAVFVFILVGLFSLPVVAIFAGFTGTNRLFWTCCAVLLCVTFVFWLTAQLYEGTPHFKSEAGRAPHDDNLLLAILTFAAGLASLVSSIGIYAAIGWFQRRNA
jgi:hypothetical protein